MKLSIITITYNDLKGLRKTWKSIECQSFRDYEWLVADGGSTDGTQAFLVEHKADTAWQCSEKDHGIYNAMNKGLRHATGDYVLFLNSGDTLSCPTTLEEAFNIAPDADVFYGDWTEALPHRPKRRRISPDKVNFYSFASRPLCHQTAFVRTALLKQSPYDETYRICADWAKWLELSQRGCTFTHIPVCICHFVLGGISYRSVGERRQEQERLIKAFYPQDLADMLITLTGKVARRLVVIRRLVWLCSLLLLFVVVLLLWHLWR